MLNPLLLAQKVPNWVWLASAAVVALYVIKKGGVQEAAQGVTAGVVGSVGDIVLGAGQGVVLGVGDVLGVPRTDINKCKQAIMLADNGKAFTYCSAGVFNRWQYLSIRKNLTGQTFTLNDVFN